MEIAANNAGCLPQSRHLTPIRRPERFRSLKLTVSRYRTAKQDNVGLSGA
jgi:hypothetical protein